MKVSTHESTESTKICGVTPESRANHESMTALIVKRAHLDLTPLPNIPYAEPNFHHRKEWFFFTLKSENLARPRIEATNCTKEEMGSDLSF